MARTRKNTIIEQPDNVVELQPGIGEQDPVEQADEVAEPAATGDQSESPSRSRGFSLNEVRLIGRIAKVAAIHETRGGTSVGYLRVATNGQRAATPSSTS